MQRGTVLKALAGLPLASRLAGFAPAPAPAPTTPARGAAA